MSDLVNRLRGIYRIQITDGLGAAGGEEPDNDKEFIRTFDVAPIQKEAADEIVRLGNTIAQQAEQLAAADSVIQYALEFLEFAWRDVSMNEYATDKLNETIEKINARREGPRQEADSRHPPPSATQSR